MPASADEPGENAAEKALAELEGRWVLIALTHGGHKIDAARTGNTVVEHVGAVQKITLDGRETALHKVEVRAGRGATEIDIRPLRRASGGEPLDGIFKVEGDTLTICTGPRGERPKKFASPAGSEVTLAVHKRIKP